MDKGKMGEKRRGAENAKDRRELAGRMDRDEIRMPKSEDAGRRVAGLPWVANGRTHHQPHR